MESLIFGECLNLKFNKYKSSYIIIFSKCKIILYVNTNSCNYTNKEILFIIDAMCIDNVNPLYSSIMNDIVLSFFFYEDHVKIL